MSFGFSIGDFLIALKLAKHTYDACENGPKEYREICNEVKSLHYALQGLCDDAKDSGSLINRKGLSRKNELDEIIRNCRQSLEELQSLINKCSRLEESKSGNTLSRLWDAQRISYNNLDSLRAKLTFHTSTISMFLLSLEGSAIARIESKLDDLYARMVRNDTTGTRMSTISLFSDTSASSILSSIESNEDDAWEILKRELLAEGISVPHIMANKADIIQYMKAHLTSEKSNGNVNTYSNPDLGDQDSSPSQSKQVPQYSSCISDPAGLHQITDREPFGYAATIATDLVNRIGLQQEASAERRSPGDERGKQMFAERQLNLTLREAQKYLQAYEFKVKHSAEDWKKRCWVFERELSLLSAELTRLAHNHRKHYGQDQVDVISHNPLMCLCGLPNAFSCP